MPVDHLVYMKMRLHTFHKHSPSTFPKISTIQKLSVQPPPLFPSFYNGLNYSSNQLIIPSLKDFFQKGRLALAFQQNVRYTEQKHQNYCHNES